VHVYAQPEDVAALERIFTGTSTRTAATLPAPASPQDQG